MKTISYITGDPNREEPVSRNRRETRGRNHQRKCKAEKKELLIAVTTRVMGT